ncbi:zinc-binding dehydrogenase [Alkalilimnicola ehrlichii]|nr:zinc-binding dehydrogenase [Alkalilimnicola ehrlichii]
MRAILTRRLTVRGFIQFDHLDRQADFLHDMSEWIRDGRIKYREDIVQGLENTVTAFQGLLQGRNQGKLIIKVA